MALVRAAAALCGVGAALAAPTLVVNTTSVKHLDWVQAQYSGLTVNGSYWLGVFYPANASVTQIAPMPYPATAPWTKNAPMKFVSLKPASSSASFNFELVNTFEDARIWLFEGTIENFTALASSDAITFSDVNAPLRGHLARTTDPSQMRVVWNSKHNDDNPSAKWGTQSGVYTGVAFAESATYDASDLCGDPAQTQGWFPPHFWNNALMTGLQPSTVYFYVYGSDANGWSEEFSFISAPAPGANQDVDIVVCADMGMTEYDGTEDHWAEPSAGLTTQHMADVIHQTGNGYNYSLLLHSGDVSYATGYQLKWDLFNSRLHSSRLGTSVPYMLNQGNHERDFPGAGSFYPSFDSGGECGIPTQTRFPSATQTTHMQDEGWYAFVHGNVLVVMVGTEMEIGPGSDQYNFLNQTLAAADRTVTPWIVLLGHRPMYFVDDRATGGAIDANFQQIEPLLVKYKVDLALWGHVHNAFVSCPVINGTCVKPAAPGEYDGPIQACIGNAGQSISAINTKTVPEWVQWQMAEWGYATINVRGATQLTMNFFQDSDNSLQHTFTITRNWPRNY